jgi:hypothetical protein
MASEAAQQAALAELTPNPDSAAQLQAELSAGSKVSVWRLLMWVVAYVMNRQVDLFDRFRVETADLAKDGHFGTRRWFVAKAKQFQFGDTLIFTDLDAGYATVNPAARIVTHAAVVEMANVVVVKVAKAAGTGLAKLDPPELVAVNDYFQELRPPVQVTVLTADADRIRLTGAVVYDGQQALPGVQSSVQYALTQYLKSLEFGGVVRVSDLQEVMLSAFGVIDVRIDIAEVRTTGLFSSIPRIHYTYAGHAVLDSAFPITSTMTWQVGNV